MKAPIPLVLFLILNTESSAFQPHGCLKNNSPLKIGATSPIVSNSVVNTKNSVLNLKKNTNDSDVAHRLASFLPWLSSSVSKVLTRNSFSAQLFLGGLLLSNILTANVAYADSRVVGELKGSGLVFKDTLVIESFDDPKVQGVTLYISNFQRPITERLQKDFFSDPSYASVGCAKTGPVKIADNIAMGKDGEEVFEESKSLLFKTLRVQRVYDKEKNTAVYISFNTRLDKNSDSNKSRFKSSICALNLD